MQWLCFRAWKMLNNVPNVEECDARGDATRTIAGYKKILMHLSLQKYSEWQ